MDRPTRRAAALTLVLLTSVSLVGCGEPTTLTDAAPTPTPTDHSRQLALEKWFDASGEAMEPARLVIRKGAEHCGLQSPLFLHLGEPAGTALEPSSVRQYVRDPDGVLHEDYELLGSYDGDVEMPKDAVDSGIHTERVTLWATPSDPHNVYLQFPDHVERWPRAAEPVACG